MGDTLSFHPKITLMQRCHAATLQRQLGSVWHKLWFPHHLYVLSGRYVFNFDFEARCTIIWDVDGSEHMLLFANQSTD